MAETWDVAPTRAMTDSPAWNVLGHAWATWDFGERCVSLWGYPDRAIAVVWGRGDDRVRSEFRHVDTQEQRDALWAWLKGGPLP